MQFEMILHLSNIFQILEQKGFDIRCNTNPSIELISELNSLCESYLNDVDNLDFIYLLFDLYIRCQINNSKTINLSFKTNQNVFISIPLFWEIISCNNLDVTKLSSYLEDLNHPMLLNRLECFILDYCIYLISNESDHHYVTFYLHLTKIKEEPFHSKLCTAIDVRQILLFRNIFIKLAKFLRQYLVEKSQSNANELCNFNKQFDVRRELVLTCLSFLSLGYYHSYDLLDTINDSKCTLYPLSTSIIHIAKLYRSLDLDSNIKMENSNCDIDLSYIFNGDNQTILALLEQCVRFDMHKHLSEDSFLVHNTFDCEIVNAYHLARSTKTLNVLFSLLSNESKIRLMPDFQYQLSPESMKKLIRRLLKVISINLKKTFSSVFTDELLHINFLTWCLKNQVFVKEIFSWYIESTLYNFEVEEKFLTCFNDLVSHICEPDLCITFAGRMCTVNEENLPLSRYIKLLKIFIYEMPSEMKRVVLRQLSILQTSRTLCSSVSFEANLRKCSSQFSCDTENAAEIHLDLEYLLFVNPVPVIAELMKIECFKSGLKGSIQNIFTKISYSFDVLLEDGEMILIKAIRILFFQGNAVNKKALDLKKISDQIQDCLFNIISLMDDSVVAELMFTELILPHFNVEDDFSGTAFILLLVLLSTPKTHDLRFLSRLSTILVNLAYFHQDLCHGITCDSVEVSVIESCIHEIITKLSAHLDIDFVQSLINNMTLSHSKLIFWPLFNKQHLSLSLIVRRYPFLSGEILSKYSLVQHTSSDPGFEGPRQNDSDIINDLGSVLFLCSASEELFNISKEAAISSHYWKEVGCKHLLAVIFQMVDLCSSDSWKRILDFLKYCFDNELIQWFYRSTSSYCITESITDHRSVLMLVSLLHSLLDLAGCHLDHPWLSKLLVISLSELIPKQLCEVRTYSADIFFVHFEILVHYLEIYETLESKGVFGLKSILLCAMPLLAAMASYMNHIPVDMKTMLRRLSTYERLLL